MADEPNTNNTSEVKTVPKEAFDSVKAEKIALENERNALKAEMDRIKADQETAKQKELESQKEFEKLYSEEKSRREALEGSLKEQKIRSAFDRAASEMKVIDADGAYRLADLSGVSVEGDKVNGVAEALKALAEAKPYLLAAEAPPVKVGSQASGSSQKEALTVEQIREELKRDPSSWAKNKDKWLPILQKAGVTTM